MCRPGEQPGAISGEPAVGRGRPVGVVLVQGGASHADVVTRALAVARAPGYSVRRFLRLAEALSALRTDPADVVILPDAALGAVAAITSISPEAVVVVCGWLGGERTALAAPGQKIEDYLPIGAQDGPEGLDGAIRFALALRRAGDAERTLADVVACADIGIRHAEAQLRRSFDEALIGMQIFDLDGRLLRVNDAFCALVGYPRQELVGRLRDRITHPDDLASEAGSLRALLAGEMKSYARDRRYIHAAGHPVWASVAVRLIHDPDGQPVHFIGQAQDISERRRYENQLVHLASHDPLTGLLNRRSLVGELERHIARSGRFGAIGALLMIDLDDFQRYNDTLGHTAGDGLILRIAHGLRRRLRESDAIARLGGDEFAVLLPQESATSAEKVGRALLEQVGREPMAPGDERCISASIGIVSFDGCGSTVTADQMMADADLAMYDAKHAGRNRIAHYRTERHDRPRRDTQLSWASEITDAIAHDRFELLAQPIRPLRSDAPTHYELLLRMRLADGDLVPPGTFLYVAERLGLIREIDRWVADRAVTMLAEQHAAARDVPLQVNLSGQTIGDPELIELIERRLNRTGAPPKQLIFEVTESVAVADIAQAARFADQLRRLGCKFALDDFGAGFGSFYYLKHLPCDYLKIDGEYVRHCAESKADRTIISAVVQIARGLGRVTIAECVESREIVEVLLRLGVDYGQGYHLGRPAPLQRHLDAMPAMSHSRQAS